MAKGRARPRQSSAPERVGFGPAKIEISSGGQYRVRLADGRLVAAELSPDLDPSFAEECLRERRTVLVADGSRRAQIVGALQVRSALGLSTDGRVRLAGQDVELGAERSISLRVGDTALTIDADGAVRIAGTRLTIDVAAVMRVLSAKVELP